MGIRNGTQTSPEEKGEAGGSGSQKIERDQEISGAVDVQLRLASGDKVKKGKGFANSWMVDGANYGVEKILVPRAGNRRLYAKSALVVDMKQKKPPTKELKDLRGLAADGKLSNRIYAAARKPKKAVASKGGRIRLLRRPLIS